MIHIVLIHIEVFVSSSFLLRPESFWNETGYGDEVETTWRRLHEEEEREKLECRRRRNSDWSKAEEGNRIMFVFELAISVSFLTSTLFLLSTRACSRIDHSSGDLESRIHGSSELINECHPWMMQIVSEGGKCDVWFPNMWAKVWTRWWCWWSFKLQSEGRVLRTWRWCCQAFEP